MMSNPFLSSEGQTKQEAQKSSNPFLSTSKNTEEDKSLIEKSLDVASKTVDTFGDLGKGALAGAINVPQGIAETVALAIDGGLGTNTSRNVTNAFELMKQDVGVGDLGKAGELSEGLVTFGSAAIPIIGWLGRASAVARGEKVLKGTSKFMKSAETFGKSDVGKAFLKTKLRSGLTGAGAVGIADFLVSPSDMTTLGDSFEVLPDFLETEQDQNLFGRAEAGRRLRNKARIGIEGGVIGGAFEAIPFIASAAAREVASIPGVPATANFLNQKMAQGADLFSENLPGTSNFLKKYFTSQGALPRDMYEGFQEIRNIEDATTRAAERAYDNFEKSAREVVQGSNLFGRGKEGIKEAEDDLYSYLIGNIDQSALGKKYGQKVSNSALKLRSSIDDMTDLFLKDLEDIPTGQLTPEVKQEILSQFSANQGKYLQRMYKMHSQPDKWVRDEKLYDKALSEVSELIRKSDPQKTNEEVLIQAKKSISDVVNFKMTDEGANFKEALDNVNRGLKEGKDLSRGETPIISIAQGILKDRNKFIDKSPSLREYMGEVKNPKEAYLRTIGDMSNTISGNRFYRDMAQQYAKSADESLAMLQAGAKPLIIDGKTLNPELEKILNSKGSGYVKLGQLPNMLKGSPAEQAFGGKYGVLSGSYVKTELADSFRRAPTNQGFWTEALAATLLAKGASQVMKTVFSPAAQIRNMLSGVFMVGANGNIGRGMNIFDSARLTIGRDLDLEDPGFENVFNILQKSGVIDQNYVVGEYRNLLKEGSDLKYSGAISESTQNAIDKTPFLRPLVKGAQNVYSGNDNLWKTVGYLGEKQKYNDAINKALTASGNTNPLNPRDLAEEFVKKGLTPRVSDRTGLEFIDLMTTDIVKATMPTYSRVPEAIKQLRRIPITGNFMAFPAEIIRNSGNILKQGMRELGFKVDPNSALYARLGKEGAQELEKQIQAIGSKRLFGYITNAYGASIAAQEAFMAMTGVDREQMDALERLTPFFLKGHTLAPIKANAEEYVDLSYLMPYEYMVTPMRAALQTYQETGEITDSTFNKIVKSAAAGASSILDPFASESLLAERLFDVTIRGGRTKTGAEIFTETDDLGNLYKSLIHVGGGFVPGAVELFVRERRGDIEKGKITKGFLGEPGRYGEEYTVPGEIASIITGLRPVKPDLKNKFYYNGSEYAGARSDITGDFRRFAARNDVTEQDIIDEYIKANNLLKKNQADLYADIEAAKKLGIQESDLIFQLSKSSRLGKNEISSIMNGKFLPINISDDFIKTIQRETSIQGQSRTTPNLPLDQLFQIRGQLFNQDLTPSSKDDVTFSPPPNPFLSPQNNLPKESTPNPFLSSQSSIPAPAPINMNLASMNVQPGPVNPNLLGNNPANIALAQRLGRT